MSTTQPLTFDEFSPATPAQWREAAEASLKGVPFDKKLLTRTHEGITLRPIYNAEDLEALSLPEAWPGLPSYARGPSPAPRAPLVAQEIPVGNPEDFNKAALADLMRGQNALAIQLDVAGRNGHDPSEAETFEVGVCGLSLACLDDVHIAFRAIEPSAIDLLLWAGPSALPSLGLLTAHSSEWRGAILGDPLTEYARDGKLPMALEDAYEEMSACVKWSRDNDFRIRTVGVGAGLWADAGGSAIEELAFGMATGVEYLREMTKRGIQLNDVARQVVFTFSLGSQILLQIAKIRADRLLWSRILEASGAETLPAWIHGRSSIFNKTWLDPYANMLRATTEGFTGVLAGVDSMHVAAFDEAARTPNEFSRRIARNVHAILAEECEFATTSDPAGGSFCIESLTLEIAEKAWKLFQQIETRGGMGAALAEGFPQSKSTEVAAGKSKAMATRKDAAIGVNLFPNPEETPLASQSYDAQTHHANRASRIEGLRPHAPPVVEQSVESVAKAFASGATLGQVREALPRPGSPAPQMTRTRVFRVAEGYEALRGHAQRQKMSGKAPAAWLANFGPPKQHKARADFAFGFLAAGGFQISQGPGASSVEDAAKAALQSNCKVVVLCSTDDTYPDLVAPFVEAIRNKKPKCQILLAGYPQDHVEAFQSAGIDGFIHIRANCLEFLENLQHNLGISH